MDRVPDADRGSSDASEDGGSEEEDEHAENEHAKNEHAENGRASARRADGRGRDVVVPDRMYKTVAVFSTLIAIVAVVVGFMLLDAASLQAGIARSVVGFVMNLLGITATTSTLNAVLVIAGLAAIAGGAWVYTIGSRFRARGMEKPQEDSDETPDNG